MLRKKSSLRRFPILDVDLSCDGHPRPARSLSIRKISRAAGKLYFLKAERTYPVVGGLNPTFIRAQASAY